MQRHAICSTIAALTLMVGALGTSSAVSQQYKITELAPLAGYTISYAAAINNSGVVVGCAYNRYTDNSGYARHATVWKNGVVEEIPASERYSDAVDINDSGVILGGVEDSSTHYCAWDSGNRVDLTPLIGYSDNSAYDINDNGDIVGSYLSTETGDFRPFVISGNVVKHLPDSISGTGGASAINNLGQTVGAFDDGDDMHAFLWDGNDFADLGTLGGWWSSASDINDQGWIVGESRYYVPTSWNQATGAFLWKNNVMSPLASLGGLFSSAEAINNRNQIVGYSEDANGNHHACMWSGDSVIDLNSLLPADSGWILSGASDINDNGTIIGLGYYDGQERAYMLTVTPEPSSLAALSLGAVCAFSGIARKRRSSKA